jgi:hypothetical protein
MSNYAQKIAESKQRSGEKALIYCLNQGLLAYYIVGKERTRMGCARYIESGPYTTIELAIQAKPDDDKLSIELLSEAEAHALRL